MALFYKPVWFGWDINQNVATMSDSFLCFRLFILFIIVLLNGVAGSVSSYLSSVHLRTPSGDKVKVEHQLTEHIG